MTGLGSRLRRSREVAPVHPSEPRSRTGVALRMRSRFALVSWLGDAYAADRPSLRGRERALRNVAFGAPVLVRTAVAAVGAGLKLLASSCTRQCSHMHQHTTAGTGVGCTSGADVCPTSRRPFDMRVRLCWQSYWQSLPSSCVPSQMAVSCSTVERMTANPTRIQSIDGIHFDIEVIRGEKGARSRS